MKRITKIFMAVVMMATVAACFAGCGKTEEANTSIELGEIQTEVETESAPQEQDEETSAETTKNASEKVEEKAPSDYELPASPEVVVYQNDKEVFHYAGETTSELRSILKGMGLKDDGGYKVVDNQKLTVEVYDNSISIDVSKLNDDMRIVVDGKEMETMQSIATDGHVSTNTSNFKPNDFKTKQYAYLTVVANSKSGDIVGCDIQINNVPEN